MASMVGLEVEDKSATPIGGISAEIVQTHFSTIMDIVVGLEVVD